MKQVTIELSNGNVLTVDYSDELIDKIKKNVGAPDNHIVSPNDIKQFVIESMKSAIRNYELNVDEKSHS